MTHVHFDLAEVEKTMRELRSSALGALLSGTATDKAKDGYLVQDRFFEAQISIQLQMVRLLNEGRDPEFVGRVIGGVIGMVLINTLAASRSPTVCWQAIERCVKHHLDALENDLPSGLNIARASVSGTPGGRA
jgi:hypothetical protein